MSYAKNGRIYHCPVEATPDVIGGKWKPLLLWNLRDDVLRFNELQMNFPGINTKMLTKHLRGLEEDGVIKRTVYPEVPPHMEYKITDFGMTLIPMLDALCDWGANTSGLRMRSSHKRPMKPKKEMMKRSNSEENNYGKVFRFRISAE